jgi:hypothetical protein
VAYADPIATANKIVLTKIRSFALNIRQRFLLSCKREPQIRAGRKCLNWGTASSEYRLLEWVKADISRCLAHVCFTPKADIGTQLRDVRFVPKDGVIGRRLVDS